MFSSQALDQETLSLWRLHFVVSQEKAPALPRTPLNTSSRSLPLREKSAPKPDATDSQEERGLTDREVTLTRAANLHPPPVKYTCWQTNELLSDTLTPQINPPLRCERRHRNLAQQCLSFVSRWAISPLAPVIWKSDDSITGDSDKEVPSLYFIHNWYEHSYTLQKDS